MLSTNYIIPHLFKITVKSTEQVYFVGGLNEWDVYNNAKKYIDGFAYSQDDLLIEDYAGIATAQSLGLNV
jgi:hypothetical protein